MLGADQETAETWTGLPDRGETLLGICAYYNYIEFAKLILKFGGDINAKSSPPPHYAARQGKDVTSPRTPLFIAVERGNLEFAQLLLVGAVDNTGQRVIAQTDLKANTATPLFRASADGDAEMVDLLLNNGGRQQINYATDDITPLGAAVLEGHKRVAELLLASDADLEPPGVAADGIRS